MLHPKFKRGDLVSTYFGKGRITAVWNNNNTITRNGEHSYHIQIGESDTLSGILNKDFFSIKNYIADKVEERYGAYSYLGKYGSKYIRIRISEPDLIKEVRNQKIAGIL